MQGPFYAIVGFSQGAVLFGGFEPPGLQLNCTIPTLLWMGARDQVITNERTVQLSRSFDNHVMTWRTWCPPSQRLLSNRVYVDGTQSAAVMGTKDPFLIAFAQLPATPAGRGHAKPGLFQLMSWQMPPPIWP